MILALTRLYCSKWAGLEEEALVRMFQIARFNLAGDNYTPIVDNQTSKNDVM